MNIICIKGCVKGRDKRQWSPPCRGSPLVLEKSFRFDRIHRTNVIAGAAIDAFVKINYVLVALLADCVDRAYSITRSTVIAFVSNVMSTHAFHLLFREKLATHEKAYTGSFHCQSLKSVGLRDSEQINMRFTSHYQAINDVNISPLPEGEG